jgi:hypothetical protein
MSNSTATKANATSSTNSRRRKKSQQVNAADTQQESNLNTDKGTQIIAMPQLKLQETPKEGNVELSITPLPGNRPIDSANLQVLGTISVMGQRPIVASTMQVWNTISVSGERPIAASNLQISGIGMIFGNRPIASNYIEGDNDLIGYLD